MAIVTLAEPMRCDECGKMLPKGARAKMYTRSDGRILVYGFTCHGRKGAQKAGAGKAGAQKAEDHMNTASQNHAPDLSPILDILTRMERALWALVYCALRQIGEERPTEQILDELAQRWREAFPENGEEAPKEEKPTGTPLENRDWARFWARCRELGLKREDIHEYLGVESVKEVARTKEELDALWEQIRQDFSL
jgi:hypothetical protein